MVPAPLPSRTVVVLGASYGGARAARILSQSLPPDWRLVVIDRNSHMNHVYVFPRFTILPKHAPKAYIPYTNHLITPPPLDKSSASSPASSPQSDLPTPPRTPSSTSIALSDDEEDDNRRTWIQGSVISMTSHSVTFTRPCRRRDLSDSSASFASAHSHTTTGTFDGPEETIYFDYVVYALGSGMPDPVNVWSEHPNMPSGIVFDHHEHGLGTKKCGVRWMQKKAQQLKKAQRIVIVGGGALGIQFATDLKDVYPNKEVTLLHSRMRFMPHYPIAMHTAIVEGLDRLGVNVVLGERIVTWPNEPEHLGRPKILRTDKGRQFEADLVLPCTGQKPHVSIMAGLSPLTISPITSRIRVHPTMQVSNGPVRPVGSRANTLERLSNLSLHAPPTPPASNRGSSDTSASENEDEDDLSHVFAVGDCAETGAIQAGHTAYWQAEVAARNIIRLIERQEGRAKEELENYKAGPPAIKVSLGLKTAVTANGDEVKVSHEGVEDLQALIMWPSLNAQDLDVNA
ncbi:hypothetical protein JCM24511_03416 [Saitozyma sp. JCM 24511]|nr:hypothetical protein JCM24511_03416 [Saitozyma sp. JCM 24511]